MRDWMSHFVTVRGSRPTRPAGTTGFALATFVLCLCMAPPLGAAPDFAADFRVLDMPFGQGSGVLEDFNGDGRLDFAVSCNSPAGLYLRLGHADGSFDPLVTLDTIRPNPLLTADLNNDNQADLIGRDDFERVHVYLGNGDGTFQARATYGTSGLFSHGLAVADFTGDGVPDVALGKGSAAGRLFPGNGDGTLGTPVDFALPQMPFALASGRLDADTRHDLIASYQDGSPISVLLSSGSSFAPAVAQSLVGSSTSVGDVDEDGDADLVSFGVVQLGNGDGTFGPPTDNSFVNLDVLDLDADGHLDLVGSLEGYDVATRHGNGDGTFGPVSEVSSVYSLVGVQSGDLNGDGHADLVVPGSYHALAIHLANPDGSFGLPNDYAASTLNAVAIADFDGDAIRDVAALEGGAVAVSIHDGAGDGTFAFRTSLPLAGPPRFIEVGDFDNDGRDDLLVTSYSAPSVSVFAGLAGGAFAPRVDYPTLAAVRSMRLADLNDDGRTDLIAIVSGYAGITVHLAGPTGALNTRTDVPTGPTPRDLEIGDLDDDGDLDVVVLRPSNLEVLLGAGGGTLGAGTPYPVPGASGDQRTALGDVNGDGNLDALSARNSVSVLLGNGDGTLAAPGPRRFLTYEPQDMALADLDLDGKLDLVLAMTFANAAAVLPGLGDGTFGELAGYGSGNLPNEMDVADLDSDGRPDIVVAAPEEFTVLRNITGGLLSATARRPGPSGLAIRGLGPNPASKRFAVNLRLPAPGPAAIELHDVLGRRVTRRDLGTLEAGDHAVHLSIPEHVRPGVYWIRASHRGDVAALRVAVMR